MKVKYEFEIESKDCMKCPMLETILTSSANIANVSRDYVCKLTSEYIVQDAIRIPVKLINDECPLVEVTAEESLENIDCMGR